MKHLIPLSILAALFVSSAAQAAHLTLGASPRNSEAFASVTYDEKSILGARLFEVLKASPLFSEDLGGGYIEPGTRYVSRDKGMEIQKSHGSVSLKISMTKSDTGSLESSSNALLVGFTGKGDLGSLLHTALLNSGSRFVLTKDRPSDEIKPQGDEAVMLSEKSYYGEYISCGTYANGALGRCMFSLNRQ